MDTDAAVLRVARRKRRQGEALAPHEAQALCMYEELARARSHRVYFDTVEQRAWFVDQARIRGATNLSAFLIGLAEQALSMDGLDMAQAQADRKRLRQLEDYVESQAPIMEQLTRERNEWMEKAQKATDTLLRLLNTLQAQGTLEATALVDETVQPLGLDPGVNGVPA